MNHGSYVHSVSLATVDIAETVCGDGSGKITYTSGRTGYGGYLEFKIELDKEYGQSLVIPNMKATPERHHLGALMIWHAANSAVFRGCKYMVAVGVFGPVQPFYYKMGFSPSTEHTGNILGQVKKHDLNSEEREKLFSSILKWGGETHRILEKSFKDSKDSWVRLQNIPLG